VTEDGEVDIDIPVMSLIVGKRIIKLLSLPTQREKAVGRLENRGLFPERLYFRAVWMTHFSCRDVTAHAV